MDKEKIVFKAPLRDFSGYATVARQLLFELYKMDKFDLYAEELVWINSGNLALKPDEQKIIDNLLAKKCDPKDATLIHFSIATEFFGEKSPYKKTIGFTMMETDRTTNYWATKCNQMSAIFVPSTFNLSSFMQSNVTVPIRVVPLGIDFNKYLPEGEVLPIPNVTSTFNFLCIGQWLQNNDRKNIHMVIEQFLKAFRDEKQVGLILKTYAVGAGTVDRNRLVSIINQLRAKLNIGEDDGPPIYLVHGALTSDEMIKLYRWGDVFVLPSMGEAWGMPLLEAAAMEIPIITTGGTGAEMFLNPEYNVLLNYEWKDLGNINIWPGVYEYYQQWTMPNVDQFTEMMIKVKNNINTAVLNAKKQRKELIDREFTWKHSAEVLAQAIEDVLQ